MDRCKSWTVYGNTFRCLATKEVDECRCGGNCSRCDFYPEVRERAKNVPDIRAAIVYYKKGIDEDIFSPEVAEYARLAVEALTRWEFWK